MLLCSFLVFALTTKEFRMRGLVAVSLDCPAYFGPRVPNPAANHFAPFPLPFSLFDPMINILPLFLLQFLQELPLVKLLLVLIFTEAT
jgi:hypothetical protein